MKNNIKRALAVTGIAAAGITGATSASAVGGNINNGVSCHGTNPTCTAPSATKTSNGNVIVVADVSTQRHDRNFTVEVVDMTTHKRAAFAFKANEGARTFAAAGIPKGHRYYIDVMAWTFSALDNGSGIYMRANG